MAAALSSIDFARDVKLSSRVCRHKPNNTHALFDVHTEGERFVAMVHDMSVRDRINNFEALNKTEESSNGTAIEEKLEKTHFSRSRRRENKETAAISLSWSKIQAGDSSRSTIHPKYDRKDKRFAH